MLELAATRRADERAERPGPDCQIKTVERAQRLPATRRIVDPHVAQHDRGQPVTRSPAAMPLIDSRIASRNRSSERPLLRYECSMRICSSDIGSTYGLRRAMLRAST